MDNYTKARFLYAKSQEIGNSGNPLAEKYLEKLADHYGSLYVKEALHPSKKKKVKEAVIVKPEKPIKTSMPHPSRTTKQAGWADWGRKVMDFGQNWNKAQGIVPRSVNTVLKGAGYAAIPAGAAAYWGPDAIKSMAKDTAAESTEGIMDKVKEYAVPAALLLAGGGTLAYSHMKNKGNEHGQRMGYSPNTRGIFQSIEGRGGMPRLPPRRKFAHVLQGVKHRAKIASAFGEHSQEVDLCDKAISRIIFKD